MQKKIRTALISVFHKDGLEEIVRILHDNHVEILSTGGTQQYLNDLGIPCTAVESITNFPEILGGRVKTLHPGIFGGILAKRDDAEHMQQINTNNIPEIDLVIVDLYPFEETVRTTSDESKIIEKIDIGGPSMIRAAAKNFNDVLVVASSEHYKELLDVLASQQCSSTKEQRRSFASKAFDVCSYYDNAISNYFNGQNFMTVFNQEKMALRYGENPHQQAAFYGNTSDIFRQLHGKELSYNNIADIDAALQLYKDVQNRSVFFAIIKHTNVCGAAIRATTSEAWKHALAGDPESAFGGVLITNGNVDAVTASAINELFFEVLIAPSFDDDALTILKGKKNRMLLQLVNIPVYKQQYKSMLDGLLVQQYDDTDTEKWEESGGVESSDEQKKDLLFANIICKHLKSNAISIVKNEMLIGKGCGQTSRVDALRHAIAKAEAFGNSTKGAVLASDAFFPFDDCVRLGFEAGINGFIQPGGSVRDKDSINFCRENKLAMVLTGTRHFKH